MKRFVVKGLIFLWGVTLIAWSIIVLQPVIRWWNILVAMVIGFATGWFFSMADNID